MDIKRMVKTVRENCNCCWTPEERKEIAKFLDNLPTVPPTHTWDGTIRMPKKGEPILIGKGKVVEATHDHDTFAYPILRKLAPRFPPGEIVVDASGYCRAVDAEGQLRRFDGTFDTSDPEPREYRRAEYADVHKYVAGHGAIVGNAMIVLLREKYGGGEEGGER